MVMLSLIIYNKISMFILYLLPFRPFERTITLQKDSSGSIGFVFKDGQITAIAKESSAARSVKCYYDRKICNEAFK